MNFRLPALITGLLWHVALLAQDIPAPYRIRYYFSNNDSLAPSAAPVPAITKLLKNWVLITPRSFQPEAMVGNDSIAGLTKPLNTGYFFTLPTEVTNQAYRRFTDTRAGTPYLPDTLLWETTQDQPAYAAYYFRHEAYDQYPVCCINQNGAMAYCRWLEDSMNAVLKKNNIRGWRLQVTLPTEQEWQAMYHQTIYQAAAEKSPWLLQYPAVSSNVSYFYGKNGYRINIGKLEDGRQMNLAVKLRPGALQPLQGLPMPVKSMQPARGLYMLLGNMAEMTSTGCDSNLFNNREFIYTVSGRIVPNTIEIRTQAEMASYLRGKDVLENHMVIKGGSWRDELFFTQPAAVKLMKRTAASCTVGFRPVIRVIAQPQ